MIYTVRITFYLNQTDTIQRNKSECTTSQSMNFKELSHPLGCQTNFGKSKSLSFTLACMATD